MTPGFVEGLGIQPAIGRGFDASAFQAGTGNVALISHRLWQSRFGGDPSALGRTFTAYVSDRPEEAERFTVIGVLPQDLWHFNPYTDILTPLRAPTYPYMVRLRPGVTPERAAARITSLVAAGAANVPQAQSFALIAAVLALIGAYGVIAYAVRQREREIAVRLAVGADPSRITRLFLRQGSWILAAGLAAGVLAVLAGGRLLESQLFGVTARDPLTLAAAVTAFAGAGLLAIWWPARRAATTDPSLALRAE